MAVNLNGESISATTASQKVRETNRIASTYHESNEEKGPFFALPWFQSILSFMNNRHQMFLTTINHLKLLSHPPKHRMFCLPL